MKEHESFATQRIGHSPNGPSTREKVAIVRKPRSTQSRFADIWELDRVDRRATILRLIVGFVALSLLMGGDSTCLGQDHPSAEERPNIILLMADDLGWVDPGYMGESPIQTPGLDQMVRDGLRLDRFYAAAPVCSPTRASCLTGRHPYRQGIYFANVGHLLERENCLAELLRAEGYRTGHFGKWHLGTLTTVSRDSNRGGPQNRAHFSPPSRHGFDHFFATEAKVPTWDPLLERPDESNQRWWEPLTSDEHSTAYGTAYWENGIEVDKPLRGDDSRIIVDEAIEFIGHTDQAAEPFFAVVWFHSPHLPVVGGPNWLETYAAVESDYARHYYAAVSAMDEAIQRLRDHLSETGHADNTLIFFCSDNGPEGNASAPGQAMSLRGRKRSLYEGGIRVPGIVVWPRRIQAGSVSSSPVVTSDYLPTICELLQLEPPEGLELDGESVLRLLDGEPYSRASPIFFESRNQFVAMNNRYKIVGRHTDTVGGNRQWHDADTPAPEGFELFDLVDDPGEQIDLASEHPEVVRELHERLVDWRRRVQRDRAEGLSTN